MAKTLIINGSPRKSGDTMSLICELKTHLSGELKIINTYYDQISPCFDCRYCYTHNKCSIDDEMQNIYEWIKEADNIIIASPIYFSQLTGSLLNFASRLQFLYVSRCFRKDNKYHLNSKNGVIMLVGGGDGSPELAKKTASILLHQMGAEVVGYICSLSTNHIPARNDKEATLKIREIALTYLS